MYRIRLDEKSDLNVAEFIEATKPQSYVLVHHVLPHGNPHYHAFLECEIKEQTLRQRIKRAGLSASDFSLKKCDPTRKDEYIQYLFNEKHGNRFTLVATHNINSEYLDQLQIQAKTIADNYKATQDNKRSSRPTIYDIAEETSALVHQTHIIPVNLDYYTLYKYHLKAAILICKKYRQPFEEFYLRKIAVTSIAIDNGNHDDIISKILQKEFRIN